MKTPSHLFISDCDGHLYDTRRENWHAEKPLRSNYSWHHRDIGDCADLKATLRAGEYVWPGGYTLFFITDDGVALSFESVRQEFRQVLDSVRNRLRDGWRVVACEVNYEDTELFCAHSGEQIPPAYGQD